MTLCRFALAVRTFGCWLTTGSKLVRDWFRAGSGLDQVWFKVGWLVPGWFPNGSLLLSCRLTAITLVSVAFLQLILCYFVALPWFRGRWGAGSQLVRNWLGAGSSLAQGRFPAGRTWPTVRKTPSTPGNVTVTLKVPRVSASSLGTMATTRPSGCSALCLSTATFWQRPFSFTRRLCESARCVCPSSGGVGPLPAESWF